MATQAEKDGFFATLDGFDEGSGTETESESDTAGKFAREVTTKRQKTSHGGEGVKQLEMAKIAKRPTDIKYTSLTVLGSQQPPPSHASYDKTVNPALEAAQGVKPRPLPKAGTGSERSKVSKKSQATVAQNGLFQGFVFYFVPNNDVAKPRRLRIQSAISQGAVWCKTLSSKITHIIVEPDISAAAIVKLAKDEIDLGKIAVVKNNWLIESLSHKSVRNPSNSRFQVKGASTAFAEFVSRASNRETSKKTVTSKIDMHTFSRTPIEDPIENMNDLSSIVNGLKTATALPFDEELDLANFLSFSSGDEQEDEDHATSKDKRHIPKENTGFQCMEPNTSNQPPTPNDRTICILQQMATYYDRTGDNWRTLAYRKAITALRKQPDLVNTSAQALKIKGIGPRLADKIEEIVTTDRLKRLDAVLSDPDDQVLQLFMGIYDVGLRQARAWMAKGYRTLDDLRGHADLTPNQKIGLEHHDDFAQRIPRAEVAQHGEIVAQALRVADRDLQAIIGGSYRRGMPTSGDIDVMITHPSATLSQLRTWVFEIVVPHLFGIGFMKCALATSRSCGRQSSKTTPRKKPSISTPTSNPPPMNSSVIPNLDPTTGTKFHGSSALPVPNSPWRRIDLLLVPPSTLGAALIYSTGNDIFNRSLRLLARKKKMRLNQYGLYRDEDVGRTNANRRVNRGMDGQEDEMLIEGRSERRIFEVLGVPYWRPEERIC